MIRIAYTIIGIIIGYLVGITYIRHQHIIYHGPDSNEVKKKIFYWPKTDKYYRFIPIPYVCPPMYINALKQISLPERISQQLTQL